MGENLLILKTAVACNISCHTSHDGNIQRRSNFTIVCKEKERDVIFRLGEKVSFRCNQQIKLVSKSSSCQEMRGFRKKSLRFQTKLMICGRVEISHFCNFFHDSEVTVSLISPTCYLWMKNTFPHLMLVSVRNSLFYFGPYPVHKKR